MPSIARYSSTSEKAFNYSTTINTADVANNLKRFASQRDDIYDGATSQNISAEEEARRKRAAVSYDGQPDAAKDARYTFEMDQIMRSLFNSYRKKRKETSGHVSGLGILSNFILCWNIRLQAFGSVASLSYLPLICRLLHLLWSPGTHLIDTICLHIINSASLLV